MQLRKHISSILKLIVRLLNFGNLTSTFFDRVKILLLFCFHLFEHKNVAFQHFLEHFQLLFCCLALDV